VVCRNDDKGKQNLDCLSLQVSFYELGPKS
jgi:hypothetical protein